MQLRELAAEVIPVTLQESDQSQLTLPLPDQSQLDPLATMQQELADRLNCSGCATGCRRAFPKQCVIRLA